MKKNVMRMLLCAVLVFAMLAVAACGSKGGDSDSKSGSDANTEQGSGDDAQEPAGGSGDEGGSSASGKFASIADYVASDEFQAELEAQLGALEGSGMNMTITGDGNKLVYTYTYDEIVKEDGMAEQLEAGIEEQKSQFVSVANSLKLVVDEENPVVAIKYIDANGDEIYSTEIAAD